MRGTSTLGQALRLALVALAACTIAAGPAAAATRTLTLAPRHAAALARTAQRVADPRSMDYRHRLSVHAFARRFGASARRLHALRRALAARGLRMPRPSANRLAVDVTRPPRRLRGLARLTGVRAVSAPVRRAPAAPAPQTRTAAACPDGAAKPSSSNPPAGGLSFADLAAAYDFQSLAAAGSTGAGQTIGVYGRSQLRTDDVDAFKACYGLDNTVTRVPVGAAVALTDSGEPQLDAETVMALAPKANVLFYEASVPAKGLNQMVSDNQAKVLSFSVSKCEASAADDSAAITTLLQEAATQGQTVVWSTADVGSTKCYDSTDASPNTAPTVSVYSSQPGVTSVGGTTLYALDGANKVAFAPGRTPVEGIWSRGVVDGQPNGSSGGISTKFAMPDYQSGAAAALDVKGGGSATPCKATSGLCRETPDVAADGAGATGYRIYTQGAWKTVGGTSAAAPLWAALFAVANSSPACAGHTVGFADPALYKLAGTRYTANFNDITLPDPFSGKTDNDDLGVNNGAYPVKAGYDMVTGLGSPKAPAIAAGVCNAGATNYTVSVKDPGPQTGGTGTPAALTLTADDSGHALVRFAATGLPPGLALDPSGAVSGTPTTPGTYTVAVTATDVQGNTGTGQFTWTIAAGATPAPTPVKLTAGRAHVARRPTASFTVTGTGLTQLLVTAPHGVSFSGKPTLRDATGTPLAATTKAAGRRLAIKLAAPTASVAVTLPKGRLRVGRALGRRIARHRVKALHFRVAVVGASTTPTTVRF